MGYNYNMYIDDLEKYCSSNSEMSHKVKELKKIVSTMNDELKKLCIGFTSKDYTREEIKRMDENKIGKLFKFFIEDVKNIYFEYTDIKNEFHIENIYFDCVEFYDDKVEIVYENFGDDGYVNIVLTEDEFFNEDTKSFLNRMYEEYNKQELAKKQNRENNKKKNIEYLKKEIEDLKKRLKELTEEDSSSN